MLALAMQFSRTRHRTYERQLRPSIRRAVVVGRGFRGYSLGTKQRARICPNRKAEGAKANDRLGVKLLRKEVIQPHLPVRLPCYDFTPIADPTFDGSLPCGLGHRLRVLPTFVV